MGRAHKGYRRQTTDGLTIAYNAFSVRALFKGVWHRHSEVRRLPHDGNIELSRRR